MLTEDYIVRMIRDMGQMLARVLGSQAWEPDRCAEVWEACRGGLPSPAGGAESPVRPGANQRGGEPAL